MYVVYLEVFSLNIVSGGRFYRIDGRLDGNRIISPTGAVRSFIYVEQRWFFLPPFNSPELSKIPRPNNTAYYATNRESIGEMNEISGKNKNLPLKTAYSDCRNERTLQISEEVMRKHLFWHRRLYHPELRDHVGIFKAQSI